jgi:hypothetical protein
MDDRGGPRPGIAAALRRGVLKIPKFSRNHSVVSATNSYHFNLTGEKYGIILARP